MNIDEIKKHMQERDFAANGVFRGQLADETRAAARLRVLRQLADDVPDLVAEIERINLKKDDLFTSVQRAEGQLREVLRLGVFEGAPHIKAAHEALRQASARTWNGNPACKCGVALSRHGGCQDFRENR